MHMSKNDTVPADCRFYIKKKSRTLKLSYSRCAVVVIKIYEGGDEEYGHLQ